MGNVDVEELKGPRLMQRLIERFELDASKLPFNGTSTNRVARQQDFSSYDYLSLCQHPKVLENAKQALDQHGLSVGASRVVSGERPFHASLEAKLAAIYQQESALTFVSGHATNVSTIAALVEAGDLVLADQLSHNSIQTGARLSGARFLRFRHNDPEHLEGLLKRHRHQYLRCLIVSEGHFSMDGDTPDLLSLCNLRDDYSATLMIDEAHALGVLGANGFGSHASQKIDPARIDIWMGTLSKSLASTGGYIAAKQEVINHLRLFSPGFTFSVGINAPCCAGAEAALDLLLTEPHRVEQLQQNAKLLHHMLSAQGFNLGTSKGSAIIPIILEPRTTFETSETLMARGWGIYPLGPPSVPVTAFRLRLFIRSDHNKESLEHLCGTLTEILHK